MKKCYIVPIAILLALLVSGVCIISLLKTDVFDTENLSDCRVSYVSDDTSVTEKVDMAGEQAILDILSGNKLFKENLSCGFSERASMSFNNKAVTIFFAQDGCGYIYSVNDGKYMSVSEEKMDILTGILSKYGMTFPCV